jgi:hypothetical protein
MRARKDSEVPASLSRLEQRFASWRSTRVSGERIPERLWNAAAKSAAEHGLNRTARILNLDYYSLKQRVDDASIQGESSTFVELASSSLPIGNECVIELEDATGCRMRVQMKGFNLPDVRALSRDFWESD